MVGPRGTQGLDFQSGLIFLFASLPLFLLESPVGREPMGPQRPLLASSQSRLLPARAYTHSALGFGGFGAGWEWGFLVLFQAHSLVNVKGGSW